MKCIIIEQIWNLVQSENGFFSHLWLLVSWCTAKYLTGAVRDSNPGL